ncbi:hypothetical protein Ga0123461_1198 [Mariprofundus aestuarium]|uniref:Uncharacterized protein n=1 Tax=Mariprofundus aestuarium TaxID=1921086 RepID=A0A2K8KXG2_MARES|nr:hypothetical protein Ga0123461_1198 [Mariprofundus aestuarium]
MNTDVYPGKILHAISKHLTHYRVNVTYKLD